MSCIGKHRQHRLKASRQMIDKYAQMTFPISPPHSLPENGLNQMEMESDIRNNKCLCSTTSTPYSSCSGRTFSPTFLPKAPALIGRYTRTLLISHNESNLINRMRARERLLLRQHQLMFVFVSPFKHNYFSIYPACHPARRPLARSTSSRLN